MGCDIIALIILLCLICISQPSLCVGFPNIDLQSFLYWRQWGAFLFGGSTSGFYAFDTMIASKFSCFNSCINHVYLCYPFSSM